MILPHHPADLFVLPLHLSDGLVLSGVELDCRGCGRSYRLTSGEGQPGLRGGRVALAASSHCPRCGTQARFLVLVDAVRRRAKVQRVSRFGLWLAQAMIVLGRKRSGQVVEMPSLMQAEAAMPEAQVETADELVGMFRGEPIPAWITVDGQQFEYIGILPGGTQGRTRIGATDYAIEPGLVYRAVLDEFV